jgi:DNA-binding NarL/FixJ family response regulator
MQNLTNRKPINILIVEDSFFFSKWLYAELLKIEGINITEFADNVNDAIIAIEKQDIDIAILDIRLKEGLGTELIKLIKSSYENIIIIIFSNYAEFKEECLKLGADYFYDKSNEFDELIKVISELNRNY